MKKVRKTIIVNDKMQKIIVTKLASLPEKFLTHVLNLS